MLSRHRRYALAGIGVVLVAAVSALLLRPRATRLLVTPRPGDDTVVVNQTHLTRLAATVFDQYGRRLPADTAVRYEWVGRDTMLISPSGIARCTDRRDAIVRARLGTLTREFTLRCRPVAAIEAPSWFDLVVGDSTRDLSFVARGPDRTIETELRGTLVVENGSVASLIGTGLRPRQPGFTVATIRVGDVETRIPIIVYREVQSFVSSTVRRGEAMAMRVHLMRGDTIVVPVPKSSFWVTYFSQDHHAAPPTIELEGDGTCTTGDGIHARRMEEDEYGKYCHAGDGVRMMIAHGTRGAQAIDGVVAVRIAW